MRKISLAAVVFYLLIAALTVLAHGAVERTLPADGSESAEPPEKVQVWFNEPLQPDTGAIRVINSAGERVEQGTVRHNTADATLIEIDLKPELPAGAYIISASGVVISDGHTATGSTLFWIGAKNAAEKATPNYEILIIALVALIALLGGGYWLITRSSSPAITPPQHDINHFPLE